MFKIIELCFTGHMAVILAHHLHTKLMVIVFVRNQEALNLKHVDGVQICTCYFPEMYLSKWAKG